jgi:hypothetical protein
MFGPKRGGGKGILTEGFTGVGDDQKEARNGGVTCATFGIG